MARLLLTKVLPLISFLGGVMVMWFAYQVYLEPVPEKEEDKQKRKSKMITLAMWGGVLMLVLPFIFVMVGKLFPKPFAIPKLKMPSMLGAVQARMGAVQARMGAMKGQVGGMGAVRRRV